MADDANVRQKIHAALHDAADALERSIHTVEPVAAQRDMRSLHFDLLAALAAVPLENPARLAKAVEKVAHRLERAEIVLARAAKRRPKYKIPSFQCKTDCEACLDAASSMLERALCYALLARCVAKG